MPSPFNARPLRNPEAALTKVACRDATQALNIEGLKYDYILVYTFMHVVALLAVLPWLFSWTAVIVMLISVHIFGMWGIVIGYHRLLSHRSFRVPTWLERTLATCALCTLQRTPARWVAWHRAHHRYSDRHEDPHTPLAGTLWAHVLWLVRGTHDGDDQWFSTETYAHDILRDPYYRWVEGLPSASLVFFLAHGAMIAVITGASFVFLYGPTDEAGRMTLSVLLWGVVVRTIVVWHVTWSVNSITHTFGYRNFDTPDASRNNWLVALLACGEGWHNNHHADPSSATLRVRWWEFDLAFAAIAMLARLGLASDVVQPRHIRASAHGGPFDSAHSVTAVAQEDHS